MFILSLTVLMIAVALFITYPLFRKTPKPLPLGSEASRGEERLDLEIEKQNILASLRDLESDLLGGKLSQTDYERLKAIDEHRLAEILAKMDSLSAEKKDLAQETVPYSADALRRFRTLNLAGSLILILLVAGGASGIYYYKYLQQQEEREEAIGGPGGGPPNPLEMVARLERRLRENPNDLQGQIRAGRSYMTLQRNEDAIKAWTKVIELDPSFTEAYFNLGVLLIQTADPKDPRNFEAAIRYFDTTLQLSPGVPAALFYRGVALVHLKRYDEAEQNWNSALQGFPPGSEDAEFVKEELRKLKAGNPLS